MRQPGFTHSTETRAKMAAASRGKSPSPETRAKLAAAKLGKCGPLANRWLGDEVSYIGLHDWVRTQRPYTGICQKCGAEGYTENANLSGEYRRDLDDFLEMCRPCHTAFDRS